MFLKAKKKRYLTVTCHEAVLYEDIGQSFPWQKKLFLRKVSNSSMTKNPVQSTEVLCICAFWPNWSSFSHLPVSKACSVSTPVFLQIAAFSFQKSNGTDSINIS